MNKLVGAALVAVGIAAGSWTAFAEEPVLGAGSEPVPEVGKTFAAVGWQSPGDKPEDRELHLRVTTPVRKDKPYRIAGTVCAVDTKGQNKILPGSLKRALLEPVDKVWIGPEGHCVWFDLRTDGHVDGFDFKTAARFVRLDIRVDGTPMPTNQIHLGKIGNHPTTNPVAIPR